MNRNIVFDICGTLFEANTTNDFIYFISRKNIFNKLIFTSRSVFIFNIFLKKIFKVNLLRKYYLYGLKGYTYEELLILAEKFYEDFLTNHKIKYTHDLLYKVKESGARVFLASATISPVCEVIAKKLGVDDFVSSNLEFENGVSTGKLVLNLAGKKLKKLNLESIELVITDNVSDISLIMKAEKVIVVTKKPKKESWDKLLATSNFQAVVKYYLK